VLYHIKFLRLLHANLTKFIIRQPSFRRKAQVGAALAKNLVSPWCEPTRWNSVTSQEEAYGSASRTSRCSHVGILPAHPASPGRYGLQLKSRSMRGCWEGTQGKRHLAENWGEPAARSCRPRARLQLTARPCPANSCGLQIPNVCGLVGMLPKAICVTGGSQRQRGCGQSGKCFLEGDPQNPDDNLWKELDGVFGCPRRSFRGTKSLR